MDDFIYWLAGMAGTLFTITVLLFVALTVYGYHLGGKDESNNPDA